MIIFRPHRSSLQEAMKEAKEYNNLYELLNDLVEKHNSFCSFFKIKISDLNISSYSSKGDDRVGWKDLFIIAFESYDRISNKDGYIQYFYDKYNHPCGVLGFFTTEVKN